MPSPAISMRSAHKEAIMSIMELKDAITGLGMAFLKKDLTLQEYLKLLATAKSMMGEEESNAKR